MHNLTPSRCGILLACIYGLVLYRLVTHKGSKIWNLILLGMMSGLLILSPTIFIAIPIITTVMPAGNPDEG